MRWWHRVLGHELSSVPRIESLTAGQVVCSCGSRWATHTGE